MQDTKKERPENRLPHFPTAIYREQEGCGFSPSHLLTFSLPAMCFQHHNISTPQPYRRSLNTTTFQHLNLSL